MRVAIFIAVFGASMSGAQLFGVSLNKIVLLPMMLLLIINFLNENNDFKIKIRKNQAKLIAFYIITVFSCLYGLLSTYIRFEDYSKRITLYAIQAIGIYIPILLLLADNNKNKMYYRYFVKSIIYTCRIQSLWALLQFILFYGLSINLNELVFEEIMKGIVSFEGGVLRYSYESGKLALRLAGLNSDPAYLCILLVIGYVLEDKKLIRYFYIGVMLLTLSRTGIVVIICLTLWELFVKIRSKKISITYNKIIVAFLTVFLMILLVCFLYNEIPYFKMQIDNFIYRMTNTFAGITERNQSSTRHILYIPYTLLAYITELDIIQKLIGVGGRVTSVVFANNDGIAAALQFSGGLLKNAAAIECDITEVLLGYGVIGFYLYYSFLIKVFRCGKTKISICALAIMLYGVMYDISATTLLQIIFWFMSIGIEPENDINIEKDTVRNIGGVNHYDVYYNT